MKELLEDFSLGLFFWQTLIFLLLLFILKRYAWFIILDKINKREEKIKKSLENVEIINKKLNETNIKIEEMINKAKIKRDLILQETYKLKDLIISEAKKVAHDESNRILKLEQKVINDEKKQAFIELKSDIGMLAINMLEKVLCKELLNKKMQKELIKNLTQSLNLN